MNIFVVPSCIKSLIGNISYEERYNETIITFESIRKFAPNSVILCIDSSVGGLEKHQRDKIESITDFFLDYSQDEIAKNINNNGLKSIGETYLLSNGIQFLQNTKTFSTSDRMFKMGGRCELLESFTLKDYENVEDKYVFKKRLASWMPTDIQLKFGSTHILETRFYSWSVSMINEYLNVLERNLTFLNQGFDTEHAHFLNIPKEKLIELDTLHVGARIAAGDYYIKD